MLKVLYLPSWYPSNQDTIAGSFFKEQAELASNLYDVRVLAISAELQSRTKAAISILSRKRHAETTPTPNELPTCHRIKYPTQKPKYWNKAEYRAQLNFVINCVESIIRQENWKPDIIHAHSIFGFGIFASDIAKHFNAKSVLTEHDSLGLHRLPQFYQSAALKTLNNVDVLLAVSQYQANTMYAIGTHRPIIIIGNFINENIFKPGTKKSDRYSFVSIAYNSYVKGIPSLLNAISLAIQQNDNIEFHVVSGSTHHKTGICHLAKQMGIYDRLEVYCSVSRQDISSFISHKHCYLSASNSETFGVAVREAMMCGLPVISTRCGGIDLEIDSETGLTCPTDSPKQLAQCILKMTEEHQHYSNEKIRTQCIKTHGSKAFMDKLSAAYQAPLTS